MYDYMTALYISQEPFIQSNSHLAGTSSHTAALDNAASRTSGDQSIGPFRTGTAIVYFKDKNSVTVLPLTNVLKTQHSQE